MPEAQTNVAAWGLQRTPGGYKTFGRDLHIGQTYKYGHYRAPKTPVAG
jgi:hypothetical protein